MSEPKRSTKIVPPPARTVTLRCVWCAHEITLPRMSARNPICKCGRQNTMEPVKK